MVVDHRVRMVGRARDADLILPDRSVSRHHFQIVETEHGTRVHVCPTAAPLVHAGCETLDVLVKVGDSLVVGNTVLLVAEADTDGSQPPASYGSTMVHALLNGPAADARGFAAVFALNEALATTEDMGSLESALANWARAHADCESIEITDAPSNVLSGANDTVTNGASNGDAMAVLETVTPAGRVKLVVPAHGASPRWIAFATTLSPDRVTDLLRRLLVVAVQICASRIAQISALRTVKAELETFRQQAVGSAHAFLGTSVAADRLVRIIPKLAVSDTVVLLTGETGVGKTFVARLIHETGSRKDEPLKVINCAAIPDNLIESELFGHERGAFTGAVAARPGALESAGRGTVLLDEIGELPLASQAKLLRVLEEKCFERVGSNRSVTLQARVIAATNRDLQAMVTAGTFRSDLFFRISVVSASVPPLRERGDDLLLLAQQILLDFAPSTGRRIDGFSPEALAAIRRYPWPGNVRELRNAIEHAVVLGDGPWIAPSDLPVAVNGVHEPSVNGASAQAAGEDPFIVRLPASLEWVERRAIDAALLQTNGNRTKAAALLGINRQTLYNKLREVPRS
ncbi:sigma 54-interacting transcriptional regulator [Pendulispora albinea]|uniref:Sigma 54-interacting transcriptional regulator n=2 Tax=Pendulispora albinea TaxID=2741071 RepID=A0ABZ2LT71_9BACT